MFRVVLPLMLAAFVSQASSQVLTDEHHAALQVSADLLAEKHVALLEACADLQESGSGVGYRVMAAVNRVETRKEMVQGVFLTHALARIMARSTEAEPDGDVARAQFEEFVRSYGELASVVAAAIATDRPEQDALIASLAESHLRTALIECRDVLDAVRSALDVVAEDEDLAPN